MAETFVLDKELAVDPALRAAADRIGAEHLARADKLLAAWMDEEQRLQPDTDKSAPAPMLNAVIARLYNEMALWQLDRGNMQYESTTLAVLQSSPDVCDVGQHVRFPDFANRILRIQALPAAQRAPMLDEERRLLAHWGQPRGALPPWPDPLPQQAAFDALQTGPADPDHPRLALPPRMASAIFGMGYVYAGMHPVDKCVVQRWWLQESLRRGAAPATALNAFRYGTLLTISDRFWGADGEPGAVAADPKAPPRYPKLASRFSATGVTTVSARVDTNGKPLQFRITERKIDVPGIRGVRPVAFETVFDDAIATYTMRQEKITGKCVGDDIRVFQMVWSFDDDTPQPTKGPQP